MTQLRHNSTTSPFIQFEIDPQSLAGVHRSRRGERYHPADGQGRRTAPTQVGMPGATVPNAVERTLTTSAPADERERRSGYQSRCGNSSWMRSTTASHSARVLRDFGLTPNRVWGLAKTDQEWSKQLEAAVTATRREDLQHGTNAAYVAGCVCRECREHQRIRMARQSI
jgi:hypothetical protein